jgi:hypothetical protein
MRQPAIIWRHPRTLLTATAALPAVSEITDTEEVTGSNPVSPTSNLPSQPLLLRAFGAGMVDLSAKGRRPIDRLGYRYEGALAR